MYRLAIACAAATSCASTARLCPVGSRLATSDRPGGRVEACTATNNDVTAFPVVGRTYPDELGMAHPSTLSGGVAGPYTHWYPDGTIESHGTYVASGDSLVPDGVWGFWYPDGTRKAIGRYANGGAVGCFAIWDDHGGEVTGVIEGDRLREQRCTPPDDAALRDAERRSSPIAKRAMWGDVSLDALIETGAFGASNPTQATPAPRAAETTQIAVRKQLGGFRVGGALGLRLSDTDDARAYSASAVAAYVVPLPHRFEVEAEARVGVQYFDLTARRAGLGTAGVGLWAPLGGARAALSFAVVPMLAIVAGVSVDGSFVQHDDETVRYCAPVCGPPIAETWKLGGAAYGADVGLRLRLR